MPWRLHVETLTERWKLASRFSFVCAGTYVRMGVWEENRTALKGAELIPEAGCDRRADDADLELSSLVPRMWK
jgi:hypothetical protein